MIYQSPSSQCSKFQTAISIGEKIIPIDGDEILFGILWFLEVGLFLTLEVKASNLTMNGSHGTTQSMSFDSASEDRQFAKHKSYC